MRAKRWKPTRILAGIFVLAPLLLAFAWLVAPRGAASPANPLATLVRERSVLEGEVEQRLVVGSYTYLALRDRGTELRWAVTMGEGAPPGARVRVRGMGTKSEFYSRRLNRTFPELVFGLHKVQASR